MNKKLVGVIVNSMKHNILKIQDLATNQKIILAVAQTLIITRVLSSVIMQTENKINLEDRKSRQLKTIMETI